MSPALPGSPCYLLAKGDVADDFRAAGVPLVDPDGEPDAGVVVIGGAEDELTYARLNHAYRLLLSGAKLIAMHRNTAWRTAEGMQLDSGPFILALETAAGVRATVIGKPARPSSARPSATLGLPADRAGDGRRRRPQRSRSPPATRDDDVLVRTGKPVGPAEEALADVVVDSVADLRKPIVHSDSGPDDSRPGPVSMMTCSWAVTPDPDRQDRH